MEAIKKEFTEKGVVSKPNPKYVKVLTNERKFRGKLKELLAKK